MGYYTVDLVKGLNLVSYTLADVSGTSTLDNFISGTFDTGDQLMFYTPGEGYTYYTYYATLFDESWTSLGYGGWGDEYAHPISREMTVGDSFWFVSRSAKTITISGAVSAETQTITTAASGLNLISCAFPVALTGDQLLFDGITTGVQIMLYTPGEGYTYYTYYATLFDENWTSLGYGGWGDEYAHPVTVTIPANSPFWLVTRGTALTTTITSPVAQ